MKSFIPQTLAIVTILQLGFSALAQNQRNEFMKVASQKIQVDGKYCYAVSEGYSWKHKKPWVLFCGELRYTGGEKYYYEEGTEYTLCVDKYDPTADTIYIKKTIASYKPICRIPKSKQDSITHLREAASEKKH